MALGFIIILCLQLGVKAFDVGPPLQVTSQVPSIVKLIAKKYGEVKEGNLVTMMAELPEDSGMITSCHWFSPFGIQYNVDEGVFSTNGKTIGVLYGNVTDGKSCYLTIRHLRMPAMGRWKCRISHTGSQLFSETWISLTSNGKSKQMRLPMSILPEKYTIRLTPFITEGNFTFIGHLELDMMVLDDNVRMIKLHSQDLNIAETTLKVEGMKNKNYDIVGTGYEDSTQFLMIHLSDILAKNEKLRITFDYSGVLSNNMMGFYKSSYTSKETNETEYLATTQFEATAARKAFPCLDEPAFKAVFHISLGRTKDMIALSNMPLANSGVNMADNDEYVWDIFEETPKMSTYLAAFIICKFSHVESESRDGSIQFRTWARKELIDQTALAVDAGPKINAYFENRFNIKYPLPKQDLIALPDFMMGAMENWGLITYREKYLLFKDGENSAHDKELSLVVISHEISHQWFGNLVTMKWWSDLWLNEGFARYLQGYGAIHVIDEDTGLLGRVVTTYTQPVMDKDSLLTSHPVSYETDDTAVILSNFDEISYDKGASLVRMMANFIGEETFNEGITRYLNRFRYSNADRDDLWNTLTEVSHEKGTLAEDLTIKEIMDTWTIKMGFPVIHVEIYDDKVPIQVNISQERFLLNKENVTNDEKNYRWWIPISYNVVGSDFQETLEWLWLSPQEQSKVFTLEGVKDTKDTLIFNLEHNGFYRVNYSPKHWNKISNLLMSDHTTIGLVNRAQILKDSLTLARAGLLDYPTALNTSKYLLQEEDYIPWTPAITELRYIGNMLRRTDVFDDFKNYFFKQLGPIFGKLGFNRSKNDSFMDIQLRVLTAKTLCEFDFEPCLNQANMMMESEDNPVPSDLREIVYCSYLKQSGEDGWNLLWDRYLRSTANIAEREDILKSLGCSSEEFLNEKLLDMTIDESSAIRKQDALTVISSVAKNHLGRDTAWKWLSANWNKIGKYFDVNASIKLGTLIKDVTETFNTDSELQEVENFYVQNKGNLGTAAGNTKSSIAVVKNNLQWIQNNLSNVDIWFKQN